MDKVIQNLKKIDEWIDHNSSPLADFKTNTEFMKFAVEIMNRCLYLLKTGVASAPDAEIASKGYTKNEAIIVGHMVRLTKLYEGSLIHICNHQLELATVFLRPIFEVAIRMEYLISSNSKKESCQSFILISYRPEKEILQDLKVKAENRPLTQIEKRMQRKIVSRLRKDGISQTELLNNKTWDIDGKNFRAIIKMLNYDAMYSYGFGSASHFVHGDWYDIDLHHLHHLKQDGEYYAPDLGFDVPDPRLTCSLTGICLRTLLIYLKWNKSDPDGVITSLIEKLSQLNRAFDDVHESALSE